MLNLVSLGNDTGEFQPTARAWIDLLQTSFIVHLLWGSLFQNFIIMAAMKDQLNDGKSAEMYFYRDSEGNEADLLLPTGVSFYAIEIKAGVPPTRMTSRAENICRTSPAVHRWR